MPPERKILIEVGGIRLEAALDDTATAGKVWDILPVRARVQGWGDEIYFPVPLEQAPENARETVALGDLAYWPPGRAFCIFFGPTPMSRGREIRPASAVNVFGRISGDAQVLKKVSPRAEIIVSRLPEATG